MPHSLYTPGEAEGGQARVLLLHLHGGMDAGRSGSLALEQILGTLSTKRVATFNTDALLDYRANRPVATIDDWILTDVEAPSIVLDLVTDYAGESVFILHGPEPDLKWNAFAEAVGKLAVRGGVELVVDMLGVPATIPHTRPTMVHINSTDADLLPEQPDNPGLISLSSSLDMYVRDKLSQQGIQGIGLTAAVPYYLSNTEFTPGAAALLTRLGSLTGLQLPVGDLEAASMVMRGQIDKQIQDSPEISQIVDIMEQQFDAGHHPDMVPAVEDGKDRTPSAEEIGLSVERFLRSLDAEEFAIGEQIKDDSDVQKNDDSSKTTENENDSPKRKGRHRADPQ